MNKKLVISFLVFLLGGWLLVAKAQAFNVPDYEGLVNDYAEVVSPAVEEQLETELQATAAATNGAEIAVVTIQSLEGDTVENVAQEFFDSWQIGRKEADNGVLLLVVIDDRQLRIQTGYGTETVITDAEAGRIMRNVITPKFKSGDHEGGIIQGVAAIKQQLVDDPNFSTSINPLNKDPELISTFGAALSTTVLTIMVVIFAVYLGAWFGRSKAWWPGGLVGLGLGLMIGSVAAGVFFGLIGLILDYILSKNYKTWKKKKKSSDWKSTWGGFRTGSSSRSSSRSSFSFGGGSSGGGGASGGW